MVKDTSQSKQSEGGGDSTANSAEDDSKKLYPQSITYRLIFILGMATFTTLAMVQAYVWNTIHDTYNTQMSVLETF